MGLTGCYVLYLLCDDADHPRHRSAQFTGQTEGECIRAARDAGWLVNPRAAAVGPDLGRVLCPVHSGKRSLKNQRPAINPAPGC